MVWEETEAQGEKDEALGGEKEIFLAKHICEGLCMDRNPLKCQ